MGSVTTFSLVWVSVSRVPENVHGKDELPLLVRLEWTRHQLSFLREFVDKLYAYIALNAPPASGKILQSVILPPPCRTPFMNPLLQTRGSKVSLMRLNRGLEAGILLVQGVIAGMTLASMYTMALADSLESFVTAYEVRGRTFIPLVLVLNLPQKCCLYPPSTLLSVRIKLEVGPSSRLLRRRDELNETHKVDKINT